MNTGEVDIWVYLQTQQNKLHAPCLGLVLEAERLLTHMGGEGSVSAIVQGKDLSPALKELRVSGLDRVIYQESDLLERYHGELFAEGLSQLVSQNRPALLLMVQSAITQDLAPRLAALQVVPLVTRAVDFLVGEDGRQEAVRPLGNGYLFQRISVQGVSPTVVCFLPSVLCDPQPGGQPPEIIKAELHKPKLQTQVLELIKADPETLELEDAGIIVSTGRGLGRDHGLDVIQGLAKALGGSVGATRPVVDWGLVSYERQIGQTGKSVAPRLIVNCGISGANEYTAGMEKSQTVIAINTDKKARIFRFADLGVIGDVHQVLPALIDGINHHKGS